MKKKLWTTIGVLGLLVVFGFGMYQSNASQSAPTLTADNIKELIAAQYPGEITGLVLVQDKNESIYEIEIENDGMIYELEVDGTSGEVIHLTEKIMLADEQSNEQVTPNESNQASTEKEQESQENQESKEAEQKTKVEKKDHQNQQGQEKESDKSAKNHDANKSAHSDDKDQDKREKKNKSKEEKKRKDAPKTGIDVKQAIDIALEHFPGVVEEVELDENNGRLIYEIEIEANGEEAEFEIDAYTGEILIVEIDD